MPEYAVLAGPLEEVTGNKEFLWGPNEQESFEGLQCALVKDRMRACLVQGGKVVGWFNRRLTRKEVRALIEAVRNWRHLLVQPTTVWTDHQALKGWARVGGEQDDPCLF